MPNTSASLRDATRTLSTSAQCPMPNAQCPIVKSLVIAEVQR
ncbi:MULTISPECIES: hypothetical protein [unclassified Nostoc]|nr:hypothetical protein [Nostoc sp. S13]MDF5738280.1 hypothetical protein [Nostoc sp. S13]